MEASSAHPFRDLRTEFLPGGVSPGAAESFVAIGFQGWGREGTRRKVAPVPVEGAKFQDRKQAVNKTSPLCREHILDLCLPSPLCFWCTPAFLPYSPLWPPSSPTLPELCFYASALGQRREGWQVPGVFSQWRKSIWLYQSHPGLLLCRATGLRSGTGWDTFTPRTASPLAHGTQRIRLLSASDWQSPWLHGAAQGEAGNNH